ncbi:hypothetical protein B6259_07925 [Ruminococcaceae bacterium CPB6]|jgi:hypothetical protein|nr:hypothetical protein B6259_07925 [Ruminococcaceae bacterium CPB6]
MKGEKRNGLSGEANSVHKYGVYRAYGHFWVSPGNKNIGFHDEYIPRITVIYGCEFRIKTKKKGCGEFLHSLSFVVTLTLPRLCSFYGSHHTTVKTGFRRLLCFAYFLC